MKVLIHQKSFQDAQTFAFRLKQEGVQTTYCRQLKEYAAILKEFRPNYFIIEIEYMDDEIVSILKSIKQIDQHVLIIVIANQKNFEDAAWAMKNNKVFDYFFKPMKADGLVFTLKKHELRKSYQNYQQETEQDMAFGKIISNSKKMQQVFTTVEKIAPYKTTCLVLGESGTGKELLANAIHQTSTRKNKPFITVNCGAIPENLLESELFGHKKGAFTGAVSDKKGLFEEADGGTLFLDEVGELPLLLQVKLLRVLQEEEIRKVGDIQAKKIDVRIIAATLKNLEDAVNKGHFREDLYYRLNVLPIHLPALKERKEDIPILIEHFIKKKNKKLSSNVTSVSEEALKTLLDYDWPGNIRELENTIERSMILVSGEEITLENLPAQFQSKMEGAMSAGNHKFELGSLSIKKMTRKMEEDLILKVLDQVDGNRTKAAKILEISHRALLYKIKEYGIS
ncbi:MAG TPA: sigma 54-interacting transcriptional regulator [Oligoflexia bacterium]|nr:sigma 54-interacting transcriptional regulator [Oligoflexia bacterium]